MDQPAAKKRRLAPKIEAQASPPHPPPFPQDSAQSAQHYVQEQLPPPPERHEFESFARHLQDAAMLIYRQTQKSPYTDVSVLILRWEDDNAIEHDLISLEQVLRERYNYRTERFDIPTVASPSIKLGVRVASFLEHASPDHLLIIYYAGFGYIGVDSQLYWASNPAKDAAKLKWSGIRCLFEEAQSDMLLLLDTCAVKEQTNLDVNSAKQIIAMSAPEHYSRDHNSRSFTSYLTEALVKLGAGRPFTAEHLYQEVVFQKKQDLIQATGLTNGASKNITFTEKLPVLYTISPGKGQGISLSPLPPSADPQLRSPRGGADGDAQLSRASREDPVIHPSAVADLTFDEPRVLVCTTFVGEASPDMSSFNHWLHNAPPIASKIAVEGMFLGPPTMLLISMPLPVWNVVQHDKVCCFLGYVNSHNMTHLYNKVLGSVSVNRASAKDIEDSRVLLEAREIAASTPVVRRHELPNHAQYRPETPVRPESIGRPDPMSVPQPSATSNISYTNSTPGAAITNNVEDSAEMQEAAEQLKALSHVRHLSSDNGSIPHAQQTPTDGIITTRRDGISPHETNESGADETQFNPEFSTPSSRPKQPRRSLQKQTPKQETRCNLCSHAPFKDSSSLRKHIAAAHTRPFPCAFAFAGCTSTFGSKNEWKRHIASQHLCLQYYRCSSCPQSTVEGKGNEFNRKDLFTQHLRRMHAPFAIKKAIAKGDSKLQVDWEGHVKEMQQSCLVTRRKPPQRSSCPKPDCASVFEGPTSWDEWTEHVGRHMEKGEAARLGVDRLLAKWALDEGIIERRDDGEYRLYSGTSTNVERNVVGDTVEYQSDGNKRDRDRDQDRDKDPELDLDREREREKEREKERVQDGKWEGNLDHDRDPEDRTIVAASTMVDKMDVDE